MHYNGLRPLRAGWCKQLSRSPKGAFALDTPINLLTWPSRLSQKLILLQATIPGDPLSKQRPRFSVSKGGKVYTPKETKQAEDDIAWAIKSQHRGLMVDGDSKFGVRMVFYTKSFQRRDIDNMAKLIFDACTGLVWADDTQVWEMHARLFRKDAEPRTELLIHQLEGVSYDPLTCEICGKMFRTYPSWPNRRFCSRGCVMTFNRTGERVPCTNCGTGVYRQRAQVTKVRKSGQRVFCSIACRAHFHLATMICLACGGTFERPKSLRTLFCSVTCRWAYAKKSTDYVPPKPKNHCRICGRGTSRAEYTRCLECALNHRAVGEAVPTHKLTADQVAEIRTRYQQGGITQKALAGGFGVTQSAVQLILSGKNWPLGA